MADTEPSPSREVARVLVVEDDPMIAALLEAIFDDDGYAVECVADGQRASERLAAGGVDLMLLDLMLPGMSGLDLCRQVRASARPGDPYLPIVMITALGQPEDEQAGFEAGADDYVTKPFHPDVLLARVHVWLALRRRLLAAQARLDEQQAALARQEAALREAERRLLHAQVEAVRLAARELADRLNHNLAAALAVLDVVPEARDLPEDFRALVPDAIRGLESASAAIARLHEVGRIEIRPTPFGPALDLDRSTQIDPH